jgi:hypothetical protein
VWKGLANVGHNGYLGQDVSELWELVDDRDELLDPWDPAEVRQSRFNIGDLSELWENIQESWYLVEPNLLYNSLELAYALERNVDLWDLSELSNNCTCAWELSDCTDDLVDICDLVSTRLFEVTLNLLDGAEKLLDVLYLTETWDGLADAWDLGQVSEDSSNALDFVEAFGLESQIYLSNGTHNLVKTLNLTKIRDDFAYPWDLSQLWEDLLDVGNLSQTWVLYNFLSQVSRLQNGIETFDF